jgi:hypothetical protein
MSDCQPAPFQIIDDRYDTAFLKVDEIAAAQSYIAATAAWRAGASVEEDIGAPDEA